MVQVPQRNHPRLHPAHPERQTPQGLHTTTFHAMGTTITVLLPETSSATLVPQIARLFAQWEQALTRFHPESELSQLNRHAGGGTIVSPLLFAVLTQALAAATATNGIYDPTLLTHLCDAGYDRSFDEIATHQSAFTQETRPGGAWRHITLVPESRCIFVPACTQIDLGGIAKGMAVDAALALLRAQGVTAALINAGGDLGVIGLPPTLDHWPVAVPDGTVVALLGGALATSSITRRQWYQGTHLRHHLLDPRSGTSAQSDVQTATVVADHCVQAEVAAKVALILGVVDGTAFLRQQSLEGVLIHTNGAPSRTDHWPDSVARRA